MAVHPITEVPYRRVAAYVLLALLAAAHALLLVHYVSADWVTAVSVALVSAGWLGGLAYLAWFVTGIVRITVMWWLAGLAGVSLWIGGSYVTCQALALATGPYSVPFGEVLPFKLLFGIPAWAALLLWYRLQANDSAALFASDVPPAPAAPVPAAPETTECIDRITVKDGSRIHIVKVEELLYIQACGDYVTLVTTGGQYVKEQTLKYFETHLPAGNFVRIHRSTIVCVGQLSRVEQFGKETYQVLLKDGTRLRVSLSGYRLLRQRLGI